MIWLSLNFDFLIASPGLYGSLRFQPVLGKGELTARTYGLRQEFITPRSPEQNGMVERVIRTLKEQCVHRHRFESLQHASRVIGDWIGFYNHRRPHQALAMGTPAEAFALAA
jgi:transposase InsO family protein